MQRQTEDRKTPSEPQKQEVAAMKNSLAEHSWHSLRFSRSGCLAMSTYSARSAAMALLGVLALVDGGLYTRLCPETSCTSGADPAFLCYFSSISVFSLVSGSNCLPVTTPNVWFFRRKNLLPLTAGRIFLPGFSPQRDFITAAHCDTLECGLYCAAFAASGGRETSKAPRVGHCEAPSGG